MEKQRAIVAKFLGRYASLSKKEAEELEAAYKEIARMQNSCYHKWETVVMFTSSIEVCSDCGMERDKVPPKPAYWED